MTGWKYSFLTLAQRKNAIKRKTEFQLESRFCRNLLSQHFPWWLGSLSCSDQQQPHTKECITQHSFERGLSTQRTSAKHLKSWNRLSFSSGKTSAHSRRKISQHECHISAAFLTKDRMPDSIWTFQSCVIIPPRTSTASPSLEQHVPIAAAPAFFWKQSCFWVWTPAKNSRRATNSGSTPLLFQKQIADNQVRANKRFQGPRRSMAAGKRPVLELF